MVHRCARDCCEAPGHVQQPPGAPRPRRWCPRACHRPRILAGGDLRATQGPRATHGSAIRPESNYDGQASSHDGACEAGNAGIVLYEAGSGPASARFQLRAPAAAPERPGPAARRAHAPPAGPGRPRVALFCGCGGVEMTTPRPHVLMCKHWHIALPRVQYDVPLGGPTAMQGPTLCFRRVLKFI